MSDPLYPMPKPPDPLWVTMLAGQIRAILPLVGGLLAGFGLSMPGWLASLTDAEMSSYISAAMTLFGLAMYAVAAIWSRLQKLRAERESRTMQAAAAVASAVATDIAGRPTPVTVTVTPDGVPNIATRVSMAEAAAAPAVPTGVTPTPATRAA